MSKATPKKDAVMAWIGEKAIYADQVRQLADVAKKLQPQAWKPANVVAQKLFRCIECLRDLELLLQTAGRLKSKLKQRRKVKIILTPLHSLVEAVRVWRMTWRIIRIQLSVCRVVLVNLFLKSGRKC